MSSAGPSTPVAEAAPGTSRPVDDVRRATRDLRSPVLGGVAAGLARHLALPVLWVRAGFLLAAVFGGLGIVLYAGLWLMLPADRGLPVEAPGLESARRTGRRPGLPRRLTDVGPAVALAALGFGVLVVVDAAFGIGGLFWPVLLGLVGVALLWRQADEAQRERWLDSSARLDPVRAVFGGGGWASYARVTAGVGLIVGSFVVFALRDASLAAAGDVAAAGLLGVLGLAIVVGPWVHRLATDLASERAERVRSQERADVAAHLHDSVLQTLALIQKSAHDPALVARLARAQERDLRSWLYEDRAGEDRTLASALRAAAAATEDAHGVTVDLVSVGDRALDDRLRALVSASGEAITNAAKHAGTGRVDVYAEVSPAAAEVFVRDRGVGFEVAAVPADRLGVRHSIVDRMARHGGKAEVRSAPGEGTEVRLLMPLSGEGQ